MYEYVYTHRVRYRECDPMSYVYHAHYVDYFEAARTEALRDMGIAYKTLEDEGIIMPVTELDVKYRRPARYDDVLEVVARFAEPPRVRVPIDYLVRRAGDDETLATGRVTLCFFDVARQRPVVGPPRVLAAFDRALAGDASAS